MKKLFLILLASMLWVGVNATAVFAEPYEDTGSGNACELAGISDPLLCGTSGANEEAVVQEKVANVLKQVYLWIGIIAVVVIVISGVRYMTSQGNTDTVRKAKAGITYASIGLVVTLAAFAITSVITNSVQGNTVVANAGGGGGGGGGSPTTNTVTSLQITSKNELLENETLQIKVKILPDYATNKTLTFASSNTNVATISSSGIILAKNEGVTTISATASNGVSTSIILTVKKLVEVESISLDPTTATVKIGKSTTIKATVLPSNAADKSLTWTSSNSQVATVSNTGVVTGKKEGSVTITVKAKNNVKATATVTVEPNVTKYPAVFEKKNYKHTNGHDFDYWINVPQDATSGMPLIVFLHGDGEVNNPNAVKNLKQVQYAKGSKKFIFIAPVTKTTDWRSDHIQIALKGLIDKTVQDYKIDTKRIYVWGFSRGAIGTWHIVNRYPNFFAAAVPVSCCGNGTTASNFKSTKIYAVVGSLETNYKSCMHTLVDNINAAGGSALYWAVAGQDHGTITANFPYTEVIDNWLLKQHR